MKRISTDISLKEILLSVAVEGLLLLAVLLMFFIFLIGFIVPFASVSSDTGAVLVHSAPPFLSTMNGPAADTGKMGG